MTSLADALRDPILLPPNRVARFYRGGRLMDAFRGVDDPADDDRPEDWVGSATAAWGGSADGETPHGVSPLDEVGGVRDLRALLRTDPAAVVGPHALASGDPSLGILVKLLDAAERLPVHCHPTREAAKRMLDSAFGKTEAWIVLGVRDQQPAARVWAGFREPVDRTTLLEWIDAGDPNVLLDALNEYTVEPGDAFLIPGGVPHAIGAGVFLLELQEPTDFSVVAETRGFPITTDEATLNLGWSRAIDFFGLDPAGDLRQVARPVSGPGGTTVTALLGPAAEPYFRALHLGIDAGADRLPMEPSFAVCVVLAGSGTVRGRARSVALRRGITFAVPAVAMPECRIEDADGLEMIVCLPGDSQPMPPVA